MHALVTGAAGFIGSNLVDRLLAEGWQVRGADCFTPYYSESVKRANLSSATGTRGFEFVEADLRTIDCQELVHGIDVVFHQAAQPGVRLSWSNAFALYSEHNLLATQRLLEAVRESPSVNRLVFASSSSVYGNAVDYPTTEAVRPQPYSPYGVTKLAAEHLCCLYAANWSAHTVALRYFTVYGPRQRPDMAIHRLIESALSQSPFPLYGDGSATRDFTYVDDVVEANIAAATADIPPATVANIAGGGSCSLLDLITLVGELVGQTVPILGGPPQPGDVKRTGGSIERARAALGWKPGVSLRDGVKAQVEWHKANRPAGIS